MQVQPLKPLLVLALAAAAVLAAWPADAADWPQWRGSARDGRSPDTGLLQAWPDGGPPLAFKASGLGSGYSSVAVAGERIYTLGDLEDVQYVFALAREDGKLLWKTQIGPAWKDEYLGPRSTPTLDGDRVYVLGTDGDLLCLTASSGETQWRRNLREEFGGGLMKAKGEWDWKFAESPLVDGERVVVTPGARDAALVALNKKNGKELWRTTLPELGERGADGAGYASAVVLEIDGARQYVQLLGRGLVGVDAATGKFLWGYNRVANDIANIPTPIVDGSRIFTSTGYGTGAALLDIGAGEEGVVAKEKYFLPGDTFQNHHGGMILHGGHVYTGSGHNKGFPLAVELATGKIAWGPVRNEGKGSAAIAYADGRLYLRYQDGRMVLVEATAEEYREHGTFMIPDVKQFSWSHPVVIDGRLYLREQDSLYVYDVRAQN